MDCLTPTSKPLSSPLSYGPDYCRFHCPKDIGQYGKGETAAFCEVSELRSFKHRRFALRSLFGIQNESLELNSPARTAPSSPTWLLVTTSSENLVSIDCVPPLLAARVDLLFWGLP
jgi:hypothetical protein